MRMLSIDRVVFVTKDRNAFLTQDGAIHPDLINDLQDHERDSLIIVESIAEAILEANRYTARINALELELGVRLLEHVRDFDGSAWDENLGDIHGASLPEQLIDPRLTSVSLTGVEVLTPAQRLSDGVVSAAATAYVTIVGRTTSADWTYDLEPLGEVRRWTDDHDDPVFSISIRARIQVSATMRFDPDFDDPRNVQPAIDEVELFWDLDNRESEASGFGSSHAR